MTRRTDKEWWRGAIFYEIYPRSFRDKSGDGIGDLLGIVEQLEYVSKLGVDGIWLAPFYRSPMKDFGYDVSDHTDVDPAYGTLDDFDRLLEKAHRLGLAVIIDQVWSHTSDEHPWFERSRQSRDNEKSDWYVWADPKPDGTPPNNWLSMFGGPAWKWDTRRRQYYMHGFLSSQPDLNVRNPVVQNALLEVARFWLSRGVDGFRLDVANNYICDARLRDNPPKENPGAVNPFDMQRHLHDRSQPENLAFLARVRALLDSFSAFSVAEMSTDLFVERMIEYTDGPDRLHTAYGFELIGETFGADHFRNAIERLQRASGTAWPSWAFTNHDAPRFMTRWHPEDQRRQKAKMLCALLATLRGTIFLYQGDELGLEEATVPFDELKDPFGIEFWPRFKGRDGCRTPMPWSRKKDHAGFSSVVPHLEPWLPVDPAHTLAAVDVQESDPNSVLAFVRRFLAWRKEQPALQAGELRFLDAPAPILAFERTSSQQRILCAFNLCPKAAKTDLPLPANAEPIVMEGFEGTWKGELALPAWGMAYARCPMRT